MTLRTSSMSLAILLACTAYARPFTQETHPRQTGLNVAQLEDLAGTLPPLPGTIQSIQFLRTETFWIDGAAILTDGEDSGWQIFVLHLNRTGKFSLEWKSGKLDASFAVSSANRFRTRRIGLSRQAVEFSGCAPHNCPDVYSTLLYVPAQKMAFTATYVSGKILYSTNSESSENREYKEILNKLLKEHEK